MDSIQPDPPDHITLDNNQPVPVEPKPPLSMNYLQALSQTVPSTDIPQLTRPCPPAAMEIEMGDNDEMLKGEAINSRDGSTIVLPQEDKARIYRSCSYSVIVKLTRKKVNHAYLKHRLTIMWKPTEELILIDLGNDYFIVKFFNEENMFTVIQKGPWFINGSFLSVRKWHPNFVASTGMTQPEPGPARVGYLRPNKDQRPPNT
ncbi:hypothetical protein BC332_13681 [Capsicum chinense]|nr:hypothetical protein BC332_13681 [Capsicum chinense]